MYLVIDSACFAFLAVLAVRVAMLRRWRRRMAGASGWLFWSSIAQAIGLVVAPVVLVTVIPRLSWVDVPLRSLVLLVPDLSWVGIVGSTLALMTGVTMAIVLYQTIVKTRRSHRERK